MLHLRLHQFRCHAELELALHPGRSFFFGANGQGKTSILEAVHFLGRLKSFRTAQTRELVAWGQAQFRLEATSPEEEHLSVTWSEGERQLVRDRQPIGGVAEFWGRLACVLFVDADRLLITGPGAARRSWFDALIAQRDPAYLPIAQRYARVLKQRNAWLKQTSSGGAAGEVGATLTGQLTELGHEMTRRRAALTDLVARHWPAVLHRLGLTGVEGHAKLTYQPSFPPPRDGQIEAPTAPDWDRVADSELRQGLTLLGPHRDDWDLQLGEHALGRFGSEGQQRAGALALRLAEAELIREAIGRWPIFLLDDVTPQLDEHRRAALARELPEEAYILVTSPEDRGWLRVGSNDAAYRVSPSHVGLVPAGG